LDVLTACSEVPASTEDLRVACAPVLPRAEAHEAQEVCDADAVAPERIIHPKRAERLKTVQAEVDAASSIEDRVSAAEKLIMLLTPDDLAQLADSDVSAERKAARMALEYAGAEDVSWKSAQESLLGGKTFVKEIIGMDRGAYLTKRSLPQLEEFGTLEPKSISQDSIAARAVALYLDACITSAKSRMGLPLTAPVPKQKICVDEPPDWPAKVHMDSLQKAVTEAAKWGKTAFIVCSGCESEVSAALGLLDCDLIDAAFTYESTSKKVRSVDEATFDLNRQLIAALQRGRPIHISLSDKLVPFQSMFCAAGLFPKAVFNTRRLRLQAQGGHIRGCLGTDAKSFLQERSKAPECYSVVTTDLTMCDASARLPQLLPHYDEMVMIEVA